MAKSFFKLNVRRAFSDNTYPIVLCVGYGRDMYISTGLSSAVDDWDKGAQLYTGKGAKSVNAVLNTILATTTARILELRANGMFDTLTNSQLKAMLQDLDLQEPPKERHTLADMFARFIGTKSGRTAQIYESTMVRLRRYCQPERVTFDEVGKAWLDGFISSMGDLTTNSQSLHMRNLRAVNNYAVDCGVTANYPFRRYQMPRQTARKRAMGADVLRRLASLPVGNNQPYLDIFMLTFYLIGINFVDLCRLESITDGRIEYDRAKTHKPYSIKVEPEAMEIIDRLRGEKRLLYMLDNHKDYRSYYRQLRRGLDAIKETYNRTYPNEPLKELTTYWARHSWATIAAKLDIPKETISAALGHDMGNSMTAIYIDFDRSKVDEANRKVISYIHEEG